MALIGLWVAMIVGFGSPILYLRKMTDTLTPCNEDWFCIYDLCQYPALVFGISYSIVITQGMLCHGLIEKKSGFLTPWLFASFIAIIGLAVNFGYVSCFIELSLIFITQI